MAVAVLLARRPPNQRRAAAAAAAARMKSRHCPITVPILWAVNRWTRIPMSLLMSCDFAVPFICKHWWDLRKSP